MKEYPTHPQPQAEDQPPAAVDNAAADGPSFEQLLADPNEQFDTRSEVGSALIAAAEACTAAIVAGPGEADLTPAELAALEALDPAELDQLARDFNTAVILVGAGYGKWPDVGNHEIPCCTATAVMGHAWCTCWEPLYDAEQAPARTDLPAGMQPAMCHDCAYRPKSPERTGDPDAKHEAEDLQRIVVTGDVFWCHQGMRRPKLWRHPTTGAVVLGSPHDYKPLMVDKTPYQADGTPGLLCAGWVALRTKHRRDQALSNNCSNGADEDGTRSIWDQRTCRVCGCTDDRGCAPIDGESCSWVTGTDALDSDLCTRCQPLEQLLGQGASEPVDLITGFDPGTGPWPSVQPQPGEAGR